MRIVTLVCTLLLAAGSGAQVRKVNAPSTVQSIIVFTAGAQVQRTSTVHLPAGRTEVSFTGLSNQLLQQSLQLKADAAVTLLSVQSEKDFFTRRQMDEEERDLRVLGAELTEKIEQGGRMLEVYKREEAMLEKNQAVGGSSGWKAAELKEALDLHRLRLAEVFNKQLEWKNTLSKLQADQNRVQGRLNEIGRKRDSVQMVVVALVESKEARTVTFQLRYGVRDAGWYPTYDIRMNEPGKPLSLVMNANLFQRSGETWKDVRLQLSSGNPDDNATRTELEPWRLGYLDRSVLWEPGPAGQFAGRVVDDQGVPLSG
ncbi:MAG TPA: DUF4139 domain-containing protein, partial [Chitinophagaceae bacterium]|nr:DUF4139 domain-containing protein [Chitinophagaceae bacterium]